MNSPAHTQPYFYLTNIELWKKLRHRELGWQVLFTQRHRNCNPKTFNLATGLHAGE